MREGCLYKYQPMLKQFFICLPGRSVQSNTISPFLGEFSHANAICTQTYINVYSQVLSKVEQRRVNEPALLVATPA